MMKDVLKRGLIIGLIFVAIACVGGIAFLDLPVILVIVLLVVILGLVSYIVKSKRSGDE